MQLSKILSHQTQTVTQYVETDQFVITYFVLLLSPVQCL